MNTHHKFIKYRIKRYIYIATDIKYVPDFIYSNNIYPHRENTEVLKRIYVDRSILLNYSVNCLISQMNLSISKTLFDELIDNITYVLSVNIPVMALDKNLNDDIDITLKKNLMYKYVADEINIIINNIGPQFLHIIVGKTFEKSRKYIKIKDMETHIKNELFLKQKFIELFMK